MTKIIDFFLDWKVKLVILVAILGLLFTWYTYKIDLAVSQVKSQVEQEYVYRYMQLTLESQNTQYELEATIKQQQKEKDEAIKRITVKYNDLVGSLSERPTRSTSNDGIPGSSSNPESPKGATGMQLSRDDAEFLARFARDTSELQAHLNTCYRDYEAVEKTLNDFKKKHQLQPKTD